MNDLLSQIASGGPISVFNEVLSQPTDLDSRITRPEGLERNATGSYQASAYEPTIKSGSEKETGK